MVRVPPLNRKVTYPLTSLYTATGRAPISTLPVVAGITTALSLMALPSAVLGVTTVTVPCAAEFLIVKSVLPVFSILLPLVASTAVNVGAMPALAPLCVVSIVGSAIPLLLYYSMIILLMDQRPTAEI